MPRLTLVNVVDREIPGFSSFRISKIPPLSLAYVAAVTPPHWQTELVDESFHDFHVPDRTDLVGISTMTQDAFRAYEISRKCRDRGIPVVMGGIHATMNADEALQVADSVVMGEAEHIWPRVIRDFEQGRMHRTYQGEWKELDGLPVPRRDLFSSAYRTATIQTARGCPFGCEFCSVSRFNGGRYRTRPVEEVLDEIASLPQKALFFLDDNLFGTGRKGRERALSIFRKMHERKIKKYWFGQTSLEMARDKELLSWAARSGCKLLLIGFESMEEDSLERMGKHVNIRLKPGNYREYVRMFHRAGIGVWGCFVFGSDGECLETLKKSHAFFRKSGIDVYQLTPLTPLPGTRLYERLSKEGRIHYTRYPSDWRRYAFLESVIRPKNFTKDELDRALLSLRRRYWGSSSHLLFRFFRVLFKTRSITTALAVNKMNRSFQTMYRHFYQGPWRPSMQSDSRS